MRIWSIAASVSLLCFGCGGKTPSTTATTGEATADKPTPSAKEPQPAATACLPRELVGKGNSHFRLRGTKAGAILCHKQYGSHGGDRRACWRVDDAGKVHPHDDTSAPPGVGYPVGDEWTHWKVTSSDGKYRAEGRHNPAEKEDQVTFYDNHTGKELALLRPSKDINTGVSATITAAYMVGDVLFLRDSDAGPHEDVIAFKVDGSTVGEVEDELSEGSISIDDAGRILFVQNGLVSVAVYSTKTRKTRTFKRAIAGADACSAREVDGYTLGIENPCDEQNDAAAKKCCDWATRELAPYRGALATTAGAGKLVVAKTGKGFGTVEWFDIATGKRTATKDLLCAKAP